MRLPSLLLHLNALILFTAGSEYEDARKNPLRKMTAEVLANVEDEKIEEQ